MALDGTAASGHKQHTILVVDDDADARLAYAALLSAHGYSVVVASDGGEAVDLLEAGLRPSVIVLDLNMPTMDGWAFLRHLRRTARSAIPVVVTSGDVRERPAMGEDAWLQKPVAPDRFYAIVARLSADASANPRVSGFRDT